MNTTNEPKTAQAQPPQITMINRKELILAENVRVQVSKDGLGELAESIKKDGILEPITVRSIKGGRHEVIIGKRRFLASELAGYNVLPCMVKVIPDDEIESFQVIENIQREGLHPMDEANALMKLSEKITPDQIATRLGMSTSYVQKRMRLTLLTKEIQKLFQEGSMELSQAIIIARLNPDDQTRCVKDKLQTYPVKHMASAREISHWIFENIFLKFGDAPFDLKDPDLFPKAGSCDVCPKRTKNNFQLFDDIAGKEDRCTDGTCFKQKIANHIQIQKAKVQEKIGKGEKVLTAKGMDWNKEITVEGVKVKPVDKNTKGAIPIVITKVDPYASANKKELGQVVYVEKNFKEKAAKAKLASSSNNSAEQQKRNEEMKKTNAQNSTFNAFLFRKIFDNIKSKNYKAPKNTIAKWVEETLDYGKGFDDGIPYLLFVFDFFNFAGTDFYEEWDKFDLPGKKGASELLSKKLMDFDIERALNLMILADEFMNIGRVDVKSIENLCIGECCKAYKIDVVAEKKKWLPGYQKRLADLEKPKEEVKDKQSDKAVGKVIKELAKPSVKKKAAKKAKK